MLAAVTDGAVALGAGAALAVGAAAAVLGPLWRGESHASAPNELLEPGPASSAAAQASAVDALREIEFDRATGKLSDVDYAALKAEYTRQALAELRAGDRARRPAVSDDAAEAAIRRYRAAPNACAAHGSRPEPDATFCSDCGRYLPGSCPKCGEPCDAEAQRYCAECGHALAA